MPSLKACTLGGLMFILIFPKKRPHLQQASQTARSELIMKKVFLREKENCIQGDTINVLLMKGLTRQKQRERNRNRVQ